MKKSLLPLILVLPACVDPSVQHATAHARAVAAANAYSLPGQTTTVTTSSGVQPYAAPPVYVPARTEPVEVILRTDESRGRYYGPMDIANDYADSLRR